MAKFNEADQACIKAEQDAAAAQLAAERAEMERQLAEAQEQTRIAAEKAETDRKEAAAKLEAERLAAEAAAAEKAAKKADKAVGQKTGLRVVVTAEITDMSAFAKWAWVHDKAALEEHFAARASDLARAGRRDMAGVNVTEQKEAR